MYMSCISGCVYVPFKRRFEGVFIDLPELDIGADLLRVEPTRPYISCPAKWIMTSDSTLSAARLLGLAHVFANYAWVRSLSI